MVKYILCHLSRTTICKDKYEGEMDHLKEESEKRAAASRKTHRENNPGKAASSHANWKEKKCEILVNVLTLSYYS